MGSCNQGYLYPRPCRVCERLSGLLDWGVAGLARLGWAGSGRSKRSKQSPIQVRMCPPTSLAEGHHALWLGTARVNKGRLV